MESIRVLQTSREIVDTGKKAGKTVRRLFRTTKGEKKRAKTLKKSQPTRNLFIILFVQVLEIFKTNRNYFVVLSASDQFSFQ